MLSGTWEERFDGGARACVPQMLIYHPPGETHADRFAASDGRCFEMELDAPWLDRVRSAGSLLEDPGSFTSSPVVGAALRIRAETRHRDALSPLVIEGLMLELLGTFLRSSSAHHGNSEPFWLRSVREALHDRLQKPPTLLELSRLAGVHPVHLARVFRHHEGCTVGDYVDGCGWSMPVVASHSLGDN